MLNSMTRICEGQIANVIRVAMITNPLVFFDNTLSVTSGHIIVDMLSYLVSLYDKQYDRLL